MARKVTIFVEKAKGEKYFDCVMEDDIPGFGLSGAGSTARKAIEDMHKAYNEIKEIKKSEGTTIPELEYEYKFDLGSFFDYYSYLNVSGVAKKANINASLMRQYVSGIHTPSPKRLAKIEEALQEISKEIASAELS